MSLHVFVDETKCNCYLLVAAAVLPRDLAATRREMRQLTMPGQRRVHFTKESDARRRFIASTIRRLAISVTVYEAAAHHHRREARQACLESLVADMAEAQASLIVLEREDAMLDHDSRLLSQWTAKLGCTETLVYEHRRPHEECLLWIPDAVAWCWYRGNDWRRRVAPVVAQVKKV